MANQILRAGIFLPSQRDNPCQRGPGPTPPVRGRWPDGPVGVGWATMSTKCSSKPSPAAFWFLCRRGQRNSPPAGGEIPPADNEPNPKPAPSSGPSGHLPPEGKAFWGDYPLIRPRGKAFEGERPSPPWGRLLGKVAPYGLCCVSRSRENPQSWNRRSTETQKVTASSKTTRPMA